MKKTITVEMAAGGYLADEKFYENLQEEVRYHVWNLEREMFQVLDRAVEQYGLSYTECNFPKLDGGSPEKLSDEVRNI